MERIIAVVVDERRAVHDNVSPVVDRLAERIGRPGLDPHLSDVAEDTVASPRPRGIVPIFGRTGRVGHDGAGRMGKVGRGGDVARLVGRGTIELRLGKARSIHRGACRRNNCRKRQRQKRKEKTVFAFHFTLSYCIGHVISGGSLAELSNRP